MVMLLIAMSEPFAWIVAADQIPQLLLEWISGLTTSPYMILLLVNVFLLILGIPIETAPALVIVTPVLAPIAAAVGIDPVHMGIVICLNLVLGLVTPPRGSSAFRCMRSGQCIHRLPLQGHMAALFGFFGGLGNSNLRAMAEYLFA